MAKASSLSKTVSKGALNTPTDLDHAKVEKVVAALNRVLADTFVLHMKTKNFHWHVSGKHFRDYHLLLDDQASSIEAAIDPLAERVRKLGGRTIHSYGEVLQLTTLAESDGHNLSPAAMFDELIGDNKAVIKSMRTAHEACDAAEDIASASLLENYVDEAEKRLWFLFETNQDRDSSAT
ncbi:Dps family protein [Xanthobacter sediminis]